jgi:carboxymethylenebutenolidase
MATAEPLSRTVDIAPGLTGYLARPSTGPAPGIIVIMEAYGLNAFVKATCEQLAKQGYAALAPDIFHGETFDYSNSQQAMAKVNALDDDTVMDEFGATIEALHGNGARAGKVAILGFCMGGRLAFLANAVHGAKLAASVAFYGGGIAPAEPKGPRKPLLDRVPDLVAPQLLVYGAKDTAISGEEHGRLARALTEANKRYTLAVLPDAPHAFATFDRPNYREAAATEAYRMTYAFIADGFAR